MDDVAIARALHVLGVVIWIGGVAMVTMMLLPAIRRGDLGPNRLQVFEAIERRFAWHARIATIIVGATGFYMTQRLGLWDRFRSGGFWWMHAMVRMAAVYARSVRGRTARSTPLVPCASYGSARRRFCFAASRALAAARAQRHHDPRGRRSEPGNVPVLTVRSEDGPRLGEAASRRKKAEWLGSRQLNWLDGRRTGA
jgi:hypothetical protein